PPRPTLFPYTTLFRSDPATRRNLELVETLSGQRDGALLGCIDLTLTGAGARLLAQRLQAPLTDAKEIADRHDAVAWLVDGVRLRSEEHTSELQSRENL